MGRGEEEKKEKCILKKKKKNRCALNVVKRRSFEEKNYIILSYSWKDERKRKYREKTEWDLRDIFCIIFGLFSIVYLYSYI